MDSPLVSADWLAERLDDPSIVVVDCRWYLPPFDTRDPDVEYKNGHIPGAVQLLWTTGYDDPDHELPNMLASPERFAEVMSATGIGDDHHVVAYDDNHVTVAARLWWALRVYGHSRVSVLNGGYDNWVADGRATSTDMPTPSRAVFTARQRSELYATKDDVLAAWGESTVSLIDGRMEGAYRADGGSIPGSVRLPGIEFVDGDGWWPTNDAARARIAQEPDASAERIIAYCTGGVGACGTALAYAIAGRDDVSVYDGSWSEWGIDPDTPKVPIPDGSP